MYWSAGLQRWITAGDDGESTLLLLFASMIVSGACVYYHLFFCDTANFLWVSVCFSLHWLGSIHS